MMGMTAYQIYQSLHNGRGPGTMQAAYDTAKAESMREEDRAKRINELAGKIEGGWQGEAGAAAFGAARPIAVVSAVGATNLELTHNLLEQQTHSFGSARTSVKPVSEKPPETGFWDDISPWDTDTEDKQAQHQADSDHNIRVYGQYDEQSYSNETSLPTDYSTLQDPGGEITVQRPDEPPPPPPYKPGEKNDPVTPPGSGDERDPWTPPRPPGDGDDPVKPSGTGDDDGRTTPQRDDPTRPQPPPNTPTRPPLTPPPVGPPGLPPFTPPYGPGGGPGRGPGSGPGGSGSGRGPGGSGMGRGPGGGAGGFGGRPGGFGPGGGMGGGPEAGARAAAGALGEHGQNARGGAGAAGAAGAGAAGQGRGGGAGGMGGGGGGRGQGGEDDEHTRASFLQEADPEAIFGTDQMTAPPVIGE